MTSKPLVYEYIDFRKYLTDFQSYKFEQDKSFSKSEFSRMLGLPNTRSYFTDVLRGKKISDQFVDRFVRILEFSRDEAQFFRVLIKFNQSNNTEERELYFDQIVSLNRTPKKVLDPNVYKYYKNWYHSVIRAYLEFLNIGTDVTELHERIHPVVSVKQIRESIALMGKLGLIKKNSKGFWKPVDQVITSGEFAREELIRQRQLKLLDIAQVSLLQSKEKPHRLISKTIGLSEEGYKRIEKKLSKVSAEINSIIHKDEKESDRVYQLLISLTPNTK